MPAMNTTRTRWCCAVPSRRLVPACAASKIAFDKYGARMLARGGAYEQTEGRERSRNVVIEFPSLKAAQDCYHSPEYQAARAIRLKYAEAEMVLVEGVEE